MINKKIEKIVDEIIKKDKKINEQIKDAVDNLKIISNMDVYDWFGIDILDFEELRDFARLKNVEREDQKIAVNTLSKINKIINIIPKINDKIIKSGKKLDKNTMSYLLRKNEESEDTGTIINVMIDGEGEEVGLDKLVPKEILDKTKEKKGGIE